MSFFSALADSYLRWRHSKGFGVHSPFAFSLVENVINLSSRYGYYSYKKIKSEEVRFLLRLISFLNLKAIVGDDSDTPGLQELAKSLRIKFIDLKKRNFTQPASKAIIVITAKFNDVSFLKETLQKGNIVMAFEPVDDIERTIENTIDKGVVFIDKNSVLTIPRSEMALVKYKCRLIH